MAPWHVAFIILSTIASVLPIVLGIYRLTPASIASDKTWPPYFFFLVLVLQLLNCQVWESCKKKDIFIWLYRSPSVVVILSAALSLIANSITSQAYLVWNLALCTYIALQCIIVSYILYIETSVCQMVVVICALATVTTDVIKSTSENYITFALTEVVGYIATAGIVLTWICYVWTEKLKQRKATIYSLGEPDVLLGLYLRCLFVLAKICDSLAFNIFMRNERLNLRIVINACICLGCTLILGNYMQKLYTKAIIDSKLQSNYVRYISHEIRSPLSTVTLGIDLVVQSLREQQSHTAMKAVEMLQDINLSCDIAITNINNLLDFDKLKSNICEINKQFVFVNEYITRCIYPFLVQAESMRVKISITLAPCQVCRLGINVDSHRFEQVIRNLLSNALKFSRSGSTVYVKCEYLSGFTISRPFISQPASSNGVLRIDVIDEGPGMTPDQLARLFGEYVQFNPSLLQNGKGSGLGLWLSKLIVELHGGVISATSNGEGQGSKFSVEIPCLAIHSELSHKDRTVLPEGMSDNEQKSDSSAATLPTTAIPTSTTDVISTSNSCEELVPRKKLSFLVCDDSLLSRKMMFRLLQPFSIHCDLACDGEEAVEKMHAALENQTMFYDVIIMDLYMPRRCGTEAVCQIRSAGYTGLIIGLTGAPTEEAQSFLTSGADVVLGKPFDAQELLRNIYDRNTQQNTSPV